MYLNTKFPNYENASKAAKKEMNKKATEWIDHVQGVLEHNDLRDDAKAVNRFEKKSDKLEKRAQKNTEYNKEEILMTEQQLKNMIDTTAKIMGKDAFAKALHTKLTALRPDAEFLKWDNMNGLNQTLNNPQQAQLIRETLKDSLPYLTLSSMQEWLTSATPGVELKKYQDAVEAQYAELIDVKVNKALQSLPTELALDPARTQMIQKKLRKEVSLAVAAGYMHLENLNTGAKFQRAGAGMGITLDTSRVTSLISDMSIAAGVSHEGELGFAVAMGKNINRRTGAVRGDVGAVNFIPFARVGITQSLNERAIRRNIKEKRLVSIGAYAQAAPGYMSAGMTFGNDLERGIDKQTVGVEAGVLQALELIEADMTTDEAVNALKLTFTKAKLESLKPIAKKILAGLKQGYSKPDIATALAAAWRNEATKNTKGKVDVSAQAGIGMLFNIPVAEAFVGLKIYKKSTMLEDKFDKAGKETRMASFRDFQKFDNADVKDMSMKEKIAYRLGDNAIVTEEGNRINILSKTPKTELKGDRTRPIYDQFDIYVKDKNLVQVTDNMISFSKGSNVLMGTLIGARNEKQKIYIGFDKQKDVDGAKIPLNGKVEGNPDKVAYTPERQMNINKIERTSMQVEITLDAKDIETINKYTDGNREKFINMTHPSNKQRLAYNKAFGEFATATQGLDMAKTKKTIDKLNTFLKIFDKNFDALWAKEENKRYIINKILESGSHSAKIAAIKEGKTLGGIKSVGELLAKRKGHVDAFKNSGIDVSPKSFEGIYNNAKNIDGKKEKYTHETLPQAIALVSYYRSGLTPTTGFVSGDLDIVKGYTETATEKSALLKLQDTFRTTREFTLLHDKVNTFLKNHKPDTLGVTADQLMELIKNNKLTTADGMEITLPTEFRKMLYAPCANEGFVMTFGELKMNYTKVTIVEETKGDLYVGMDHIDTYQRARSMKIGVGGLAGLIPKRQQPPAFENGTPVSNPGDDGTPTDVAEGHAGTVTGDNPVDTDTGNGGTGE